MVRAAVPDDQPRASELIGQLWEAHGYDDYDDASLKARTEEIMATCECYMIGDPPVAFASLQDQGDYMLIRHFSLERAERGQNKGRAAFEALRMHVFPDRKSRLYASIDTPGPKEFWEKMGYSAFAYTMERKEDR